jgi:hypothetical protein
LQKISVITIVVGNQLEKGEIMARIGYCSAIIFVLILNGCGTSKSTTVAPPPNAPTAPTPANLAAVPAMDSLNALRANSKVKLTVKGPSPQEYKNEAPPEGVKEIIYSSGDLKLKAWWALPKDAPVGKTPVLVYCHIGCAFGADDFELCEPFLNSGFAVMTPTWRGENGNPGFFERYYGEVDDACAAVKWVRAQKEVDPERVYTFGHWEGGCIAALLSLYSDNGVRLSGSAGGLFDPEVFAQLKKDYNEFMPFNEKNPIECHLRSFNANISLLKNPHIAYTGLDDQYMTEQGEACALLAKQNGLPFKHVKVAGDLQTSAVEARKLFLEEAKSHAKK